MTHFYMNKYTQFHTNLGASDALDPHTLALACISLASKASEAPRRPREILPLAHHLWHASRASTGSDQLMVPSEQYDSLRATLVQAELIVLRVLGYELRLPLPLDFLPRYLERALEGLMKAGEDYDSWTKEEQDEYGVTSSVMETSIGKACVELAIGACKNSEVVNFFPARVIALVCVRVAFQQRGPSLAGDERRWVEHVSSRKVDFEDFEEVWQVLRPINKPDCGEGL